MSLYNPTSKPIVLTSAWSLVGRGDQDSADSVRWMGSSAGVLKPYGYYLIAGGNYSDGPPYDEKLSATITDAGRLNLVESGTLVDSVCFAYDAMNTTVVEAFGCPGTPAANPHNDKASSDSDVSLARTPLSCSSTGDSQRDFAAQTATPRDTGSPITMYP